MNLAQAVAVGLLPQISTGFVHEPVELSAERQVARVSTRSGAVEPRWRSISDENLIETMRKVFARVEKPVYGQEVRGWFRKLDIRVDTYRVMRALRALEREGVLETLWLPMGDGGSVRHYRRRRGGG